MLAGEYAVLRGCSALSVTNSHALYMQIQVTANQSENPATQSTCTVYSNLWSEAVRFSDWGSNDQDDLLIAAVKAAFRPEYLKNSNLEITVSGDLDPSYGFGSSSALRIALFAAAQTLEAPASEINLSYF